MIPSARQICEQAEKLFVIEDWHSFGAALRYDLDALVCEFSMRAGMR